MEDRFLHISAGNLGLNVPHLETFLSYIEARMPAADFTEAKSLLHASIDPVHAARRARENNQS